jgi:pimeloyl-ACP methyl ester carboxylesterase
MPYLADRFTVIAPTHGHTTHEQMPNSRLEVFPRSGHFPQLDEPERFLDALIDSTEPAAPGSLGGMAVSE